LHGRSDGVSIPLVNAKLEKRVRNGVEPLLHPGEELEAVAYAFRSPIPFWVGTLFEGALLMLLMTPYFVGLTNDRLVFAKVSRMSTNRSSFEFDVPRSQAKATKFRRGWLFWSRLTLELPDRKLRLRFARQRDEAEQIAKALGG
jgi:hypothetical protein